MAKKKKTTKKRASKAAPAARGSAPQTAGNPLGADGDWPGNDLPGGNQPLDPDALGGVHPVNVQRAKAGLQPLPADMLATPEQIAFDAVPAPEAPVPDPSAVRRKVKLDREADPDAGTLTMADRISGEAFHFVLGALPIAVRVQAALYGIVRKIDNSKDPLEAARQIMAGNWPGRVVKKGKAKAAGRKPPLLLAALMRVANQTYDTAKALMDSLSDDDKKMLKKDHRILKAIDEVRAERSGEKQGETAVLDALMPGPVAVQPIVPAVPVPYTPAPQMDAATRTLTTPIPLPAPTQPAIPPPPTPQVYYDAAGNPIAPVAAPVDAAPQMPPPWAPPSDGGA